MTLAQEILGANILIVDDEDANARLLGHLLADAGYTRVAWTLNATEACALHRRCAFDLILLDLQLSGMEGSQIIKELKTADSDGRAPVIVVTAQPGHKVRALAAGAKDFISKPFDPVEVRARIGNILEARVLQRQLADHDTQLEQAVQQRTAQLRDSEARFRSLTELASDWYWEQDGNGDFTKVSGPVLEMLGIPAPPGAGGAASAVGAGWIEAEREVFRASIAARQPFMDLIFHRVDADGSRRQFRVSGEPMFDPSCRFIGYRGIGAEVTSKG
jgi:PAS domain S-box-containing protein